MPLTNSEYTQMNSTTRETSDFGQPPIRWLGQADCCDAAQVGGKAGNLGRLARKHPVPAATGTTEVPVPRLLRRQRTLTDAQLLEMAEMATALENEMGYAVDLECAWHRGKLFLLQCRPITTLA